MNKIEKGFWSFINFLLFFSMNAFVVSCCFLLFLHNFELSDEIIRLEAPITFINVILISFIFLIIDKLRRIWTVDRPIKLIDDGLNKIMDGRFDTRIEELRPIENLNEFNTIIRQINKMTEELASVETLRSDFISNVSHELKTPLSVIQNYGKLLQTNNLNDEERKEYAKAIIETS